MLIKRALRRCILATSFPPFLQLYRAFYGLVTRVVVLIFRSHPGVKAVYLRRGGGTGNLVPLVSDLDFAVFVQNMAPRDLTALHRKYRRVDRVTTILDHFLEVYDVDTFHALYTTGRKQFRFMEGKSTWKLLFGSDPMASLPDLPIEEMHDGLFKELKVWWTIFAWRQIQGDKYSEEAVTRNNVCYKAAAEILKMELALQHDTLTFDRRRAIELSQPYMEQEERNFLELLSWIAGKGFRPDVPDVAERTQAFLITRLSRFFDAFRSHALCRPLTDKPWEIDCASPDLVARAAAKHHAGRLIDHVKGSWGRSYVGAHLVTGDYFDLEELALMIEVDEETFPTLEAMRTLYRLHHEGIDGDGRHVRLYLLLPHAAFQLDADYYNKGWRSILCPAGNPDVFYLLGMNDGLLDGRPFARSSEIRETLLTRRFLKEERQEHLQRIRPGETDSRRVAAAFWKTLQLDLIEDSSRQERGLYPLTLKAVLRAAENRGTPVPSRLLSLLDPNAPGNVDDLIREALDYLPEMLRHG